LNIQRTLVLLIATIVAAETASNVSSAQDEFPLRRKLQRRVTITWQGQELAAALQRLTSAGQVALWLDRRVDRQQIINAQVIDLSLEQALENVAEKKSLGVAQLGELVYIGPRQAARELTTQQARSMLSKAPAATRRRWLHAEPVDWPRLSEPRALATDWLSTANIQLMGSERIAHDLWPKQSLPTMPLVDRLVLLLAGFDLTCQISADGKTCEVVPIQRPLKIIQQRPAPRIQPRRPRKGTSRQLFTLRLENQPLGRVLDKFAEQLQLEVVWGLERHKLARKQPVSCDVQNVELDELLDSIFASTNLRHRREGKRITIQVKP